MAITAPFFSESNLAGTLVKSISITDTTIKATIIDRITGNQRTPQATTLLWVLDKGTEAYPNAKYEIFKATSHSTDGDGVTTFTGCTRGLLFYGISTAGGGTPQGHSAGAEIGVADVHFFWNIMTSILSGQSSPAGFMLGTRLAYELAGMAGFRAFTDATARDAAITVPASGDTCALTTGGVAQYYLNGAWHNFGNTGAVNGDETTDGTFQGATPTDMAAGTDIGTTLAHLVVMNKNLVANPSGAGDAGKLVPLGPTGMFPVTAVPPTNPQVLVAGEALALVNALYCKASDGKAYKTDATSVGEASDGFIGFANVATLITANVTVQTGPYISGFSGLVAGSTYYLTNTPGAISTTPGTISKPVLIATSATTGLLFPTQGSREVMNTIAPSSIPTIGTATNTTVTTGFRPKWIDIYVELGAKDATGGNITTKTFQAFFNGTTLLGGTFVQTVTDGITFHSTGIIKGTEALGAIYTVSNAVQANNPGGTNYSSITLTISSVTATGFVITLTNATTLGAGSNNVGCSTITYKVRG